VIRIRYHGRMTKGLTDRTYRGHDPSKWVRAAGAAKRHMQSIRGGRHRRDVAGAAQNQNQKLRGVVHHSGRCRIVCGDCRVNQSVIAGQTEQGGREEPIQWRLRRARRGFEYGRSRTSWVAKRTK